MRNLAYQVGYGVSMPRDDRTSGPPTQETCRFRHAQLARSKARTDLHRRRRRLRTSPT